jgi:hypothetical protein
MRSETASIALLAWIGVVLLYGLWRSRGDATPDPIRPSGPLDQV